MGERIMSNFKNLHVSCKRWSGRTIIGELNEIHCRFFILLSLTVLLLTCVSTVFSQTISSNLNEFLDSVSINASKNDDGTYDIKEGKHYTISLHFKEQPNILQFPDNGLMTFNLPQGFEEIFEKTDTSSITIMDLQNNQEYKIQGNPYTIGTSPSPGTITFNWNPGSTPEEQEAFQKLKNASNVQFDLSFEGTFANNTESINFSDSVTVYVDVDTEHSFNLQKTAYSFDSNTGIITYNLVVKSHGVNNNVVVTDQITGNGTEFATDISDWISCYGSNQCYVDPKPVTVSNDGKLFTYVFGDMDDGNEIHITYKAKLTGDGLNPLTDNGKIPEGITNNTYNAKSDENPTPTPPEPLDFHNNSYITLDKNGVYSSDNEAITWTIDLNQAKLTSLAGTTITDTIDSGSREILSYAGNGIHIEGSCTNNTTVSRDVLWSEMNITDLHNAYTWSYIFPTGIDDAGICSYTITYTTQVDTSNLYQSSNIVKNKAEYLNELTEKEVNVVPSNPVTFEKTTLSVTSTEATWKLSIFLPANKTFESIKLTDVFPSRNNYYFDTFKAGSLTITSESNGTVTQLQSENDYLITESDNKFEVTFNTPILQAQNYDRTINISFTTTFDPNWVEDAKNQAYLKTHTNNATLLLNNNISFTDDETVTPLVIEVVKSGSDQYNSNKIDPVEVTEDEKKFELPVYRFEIRISGVTTDTIEITDKFDTDYLEVYTGNPTWGNNIYNVLSDNLKIYGGDNIYQIYQGGNTVTATPTSSGVTFSTTVPKNGEDYYPYYRFAYYLKVKDKAALTELSRLAVTNNRTFTLENEATFSGVNDEASVTYTYNPLSKELINKNTLNNNKRRAQYKITYNPTGQLINEGNDITLTDTFNENLVILYDTIEFDNPDAVVTYTVSGYTATYVIKDGSPVTITYDAIVIGNGNLTLINTVRAENSDFGNISESHSANFSSGQGSLPYISILKAEKNDMLKPLSGATFALFECDNTTKICRDPSNCTDRADCQNPQPVKYSGGPKKDSDVVVTTDENGTAILNQVNGITLSYDRKYYILETGFPEGYKGDSTNTSNKWFFTIFEAPQQGHADVWVYPNGYSLRVWNESKTTKINLEKTFTGGVSPSSLTDEQKESITFTIERVPDVDENDGFPKTINYSEFTNGKYEISGLTIGNYTITENVPGIDGYTLTKTYKIDNVTIENVTEDYPLTVKITSEDVINYENNTSHTVSITNNYQNDQQTTEISAYKMWEDTVGNTETNVTGRSVVFTLYANGYPAETSIIANNTVTLDGVAETNDSTAAAGYESEPWKATFVNLPVKDGEDDITYTIAETKGYPGYSISPTTPVSNDGSITNTEKTGQIYLTVTKTMENWPANRNFEFTLAGVDNSSQPGGVDSRSKLNGITVTGSTNIAQNIKAVIYGPIKFSASEKDQPFTFTISETYPGNDTENYIYQGVTYDPNPHTIIVTPKLNSSGDLTFDVKNDQGTTNNYASQATASAATVTNTASAKTMINVKKELGSGSEWPKDGSNNKQVTFTLSVDTVMHPDATNVPMPSTTASTLSNTTDTGTFGPISFDKKDAGKTYHYLITETTGFGTGWITGDPIQVEVTVDLDNNNGKLSTRVNYPTGQNFFTVTNTKVNPGSIIFEATKKMATGSVWPEGKKFTLVLADNNDTNAQEKLEGLTGLSQQVSRGANDTATVTFTAISFNSSDAGKEFKFKVYELDVSGIPHTDTEHTISVKPILKSGGILEITASVDNGNNTTVTEPLNVGDFENTYTVTDTSLFLSATKSITPWPKGSNSQNVEFEFKIEDAAGNVPNKVEGIANARTSNPGTDAQFNAITFNQADINKIFTFTISEVKGGLPFVGYSTETKTITVKVIDNGDGTLRLVDPNNGQTITGTEDTPKNVGTFTNTYSPSGEATINVKKALGSGSVWPKDSSNNKPVTFTLEVDPVKNTDITKVPMPSTTSATLSNTTDIGSFGPIRFNSSHADNTYHYLISETNGFGSGWISSDPVEVAVTVGPDTGSGTLQASVNYPTGQTFFTITNTQIQPVSIPLSGTKKLKDGTNVTDPASGQKWDFTLTAEDGGPIPTVCESSTANSCTKTNNGASIDFGSISFNYTHLNLTDMTTPKEYKYKVTESSSTDSPQYIDFDKTEKEFTVSVSLVNGVITAKINNSIITEYNFGTFTNTYKPVKTRLQVIKALGEGDTWPQENGTNKSVIFTLTQVSPVNTDIHMPSEGGKTVTLSNVGTGTFGEIEYDESCVGIEYKYRIEETADFGSEWTKTGPIIATVKVSRDPNTQALKTDVSYPDGTKAGNTITNHKIQPSRVNILGTKSLSGKTITDEKWNFKLNVQTDSTNAPLPEGCTAFPCTKQNNGSSFSFENMTFTSAHLAENQGEKVWTYTVEEDKAANSPANVTIDPNPKVFKVKVSLNVDGNIQTVVTDASDVLLPPDTSSGAYKIGIFSNTVVEPGSIQFKASKIVKNFENGPWPKDAEFNLVLGVDDNDTNAAAKISELSESDRKALTRTLNDGKRIAEFPVLPFTYSEAAAGKSWIYLRYDHCLSYRCNTGG